MFVKRVHNRCTGSLVCLSGANYSAGHLHRRPLEDTVRSHPPTLRGPRPATAPPTSP